MLALFLLALLVQIVDVDRFLVQQQLPYGIALIPACPTFFVSSYWLPHGCNLINIHWPVDSEKSNLMVLTLFISAPKFAS